jgi:hypothetical protein
MLQKIGVPARRVTEWAERARLQPSENKEPFPSDLQKEEIRRREIARQLERDDV